MQALPLPDAVAKGIPLDLALHDEFARTRIISSNMVGCHCQQRRISMATSHFLTTRMLSLVFVNIWQHNLLDPSQAKISAEKLTRQLCLPSDLRDLRPRFQNELQGIGCEN